MMSTTQPVVHLGIDIAKDTLELAAPSLRRQLPNNTGGHAELLALLHSLPGPVHCVCEATGGYERSLCDCLQAAGCAVSLVNPSRVRQFARALGRLAKTDRIDAAVLAEYGSTLQPPAMPVPPYRELTDTARRRSQLARVIGVQRTQLQQLPQPWLRRQAQRLLRSLEAQVDAHDRQLEQIVHQHPELDGCVAALCQVEGVGRTTAITLLAEMPELGVLGRKPVAALGGLAPYNRDSGQAGHARHIHGGRSLVRRILYMAALAAIRCNPVLAPFYRHLRERGKCHRVAITAVMRKLLLHLNEVARIFKMSLASQHS